MKCGEFGSLLNCCGDIKCSIAFNPSDLQKVDIELS
jgi:hypothetical protein